MKVKIIGYCGQMLEMCRNLQFLISLNGLFVSLLGIWILLACQAFIDDYTESRLSPLLTSCEMVVLSLKSKSLGVVWPKS